MDVADRTAFLLELRARLDEAAKADAVAGEVEKRVRRYCGEHGIPRSIFLGRGLTECTTVTYRRDDDGNVVVTRVTERDPEWLPDDAEEALLFQAYQDSLCVGCGQPRRESFDKANRYDVKAHTCQACAEQGQRSWAANKSRSKNAPPKFGVYYSVTKAD